MSFVSRDLYVWDSMFGIADYMYLGLEKELGDDRKGIAQLQNKYGTQALCSLLLLIYI